MRGRAQAWSDVGAEVGDLQNQFRLLSRLHALYRRTYERKKLLEVARLADAVAIEIGHPAALARAHTYIGIAYHLGGDQRLARERLQAGRLRMLQFPPYRSITLQVHAARTLCRAPISGCLVYPIKPSPLRTV